MVWVSAPGDYAILNSNHTADGAWLAGWHRCLPDILCLNGKSRFCGVSDEERPGSRSPA